MTTTQPSADEPLRLESDKLLEEIKDRFSEEELEELVFKLSVDSEDVTGRKIDYDDLPGETRASKALNLIELCDDLNLNRYLLERCNEMRRRDDNWEVFIKKPPASSLPEEPSPDGATETQEAEEKQRQAAETIPAPAAGGKASLEAQSDAGQPSAGPADSQIPPIVGKVISKLGGRELAIIGGLGAIIILVMIFALIILNDNGEEPALGPEETTKDSIAEDTTEEPTQAPTEEPTQTPTEEPTVAPTETIESPTKGPVDSAVNVGQYTSLALDDAGMPHISYYDFGNGNLMYASWTDGDWITQTVDTGWNGEDVGQYTSLALDADGNPRISYHDAGNGRNGNLKYVSWTDGDWITQTVDTGWNGEDVGSYSSLALDDEGNPHISYYDATQKALIYAASGGDDVVKCAGIVDDERFTRVKCAGNDDDDWSCNIVDFEGDVGQYTSLALDADGNPHISYHDAGNGRNGNLKYAICTDGDWITQTVHTGWNGEDVGSYSSLALDDDGHPHISYYNATQKALIFAEYGGDRNSTCEGNDDTNWSCYVVDIGTDMDGVGADVGQYTSLALDEHGNPHISYYDATQKALIYAEYGGDDGWCKGNDDTNWSCYVVDIGFNGADVGQYTSLALEHIEDGDDIPHISYYDADNDKLMYVRPLNRQ